MIGNDFIEYYGKHQISPVSQDITDMTVHYRRREKLYRQLGLPVCAFKEKKMLEVGPGSGYNTLAFFEWGIKDIDLVEPNKTGIDEMELLFNQFSINSNAYRIFNQTIEDFYIDSKYNIIIAESFLQYIKNQEEVINILKGSIEEGGVIVITCADDMSFFIEQIKRVIAHMLVKDVKSYEEKVIILSEIFEPQLNKLRGVSRKPEDWVRDQLLNPVAVNGTSLSIIDAIHYFGDEFEVLGGSPRIFTDYSWYKDIWYNNLKDYEEQFEQKNCSLILAGMQEKKLCKEENKFLKNKFRIIKENAANYECSYDNGYINNILNEMTDIIHIIERIDKHLYCILQEILAAMETVKARDSIDFGKYPNFFAAFGRTQQYLSMVKKVNYFC